MQHHPAESRPNTQANPDYFTGSVWFEPVIASPAPARTHSLVVHFDPGARTAWHTHPFGQTLYIMSGVGLICRRGETPIQVRAGDSVYFEPGEEHWHGADPVHRMTHLAIQETNEQGVAADWLEKVSDADYQP